MSSANVKELTDSNFDSEVLMSKEPVLVDFWAEWCMPCRMLTPVIEGIADRHAGAYKVGKVDIDTNRQIALKYQIMQIPTVIIFKNGQPVHRFTGFKKAEEFEKALQATAGA